MSPGSRTYGQECGLARSMDLLGERWTLLIVRELARGPKRFRDLHDCLNGIGTNLLSARLKSLEDADVVRKVVLPLPAGVPAYDLGDRGEALLPVLEDLAVWGLPLVDYEEQPEYQSRAAWAAMIMRVRMDRADSAAPPGLYAFEIGEERFWLSVSETDSLLRDGKPEGDPDVRLITQKGGFFAIAIGSTPAEAGTMIEGDSRRFRKLMKTFNLPEPGS